MVSTAPGSVSPLTPAVLAAIPTRLRDELIAALNEVLRNYRERRWEPSELNGGKLCEVVYTYSARSHRWQVSCEGNQAVQYG